MIQKINEAIEADEAKESSEQDFSSSLQQKFYHHSNRLEYLPSQYKYNLTISHERKFLWYRVAKVGTRTILAHLKQHEVPLNVVHAGSFHYPPRAYTDYFRFAFVRNPWDRLVSCHTNKVLETNYFEFGEARHEKMKCFERFVDFVAKKNIQNCDRHIRAQSSLIDLNNVDFVGRMENFTEDVNMVFRNLGIPELDGLKENSTTRKHYRDYYDDKLAKKVAEIYQKDIQIFGYKF